MDNVINGKRFIAKPKFAPCTIELKKRIRWDWERENLTGDDVYVFGFDDSKNERERAKGLEKSLAEARLECPLIDNHLTKEDCHGICESLGIRRPAMYDLGYPNNNCIGCVKGGKGYWNKIRADFPEVFERRARQEREIGHSCIKGVFLDELDPDAGRNKVVVPACSFFCGEIIEEAGVGA